MELTFLKSKLHRACVTHAEVAYEGSCAIDSDLLHAAGIAEYEQLHVYNLGNGERFVTYAISASAQSGIVSVNGAAAHKAAPGDLLIICTYCRMREDEAKQHKPELIYLDGNNRIVRTASHIPMQLV